MKSENVTALHPQHIELTKEIGDLMTGKLATKGQVNYEKKEEEKGMNLVRFPRNSSIFYTSLIYLVFSF